MKFADWLSEYSKETTGQHVCVTCGATVTLEDVDDFVGEVLAGGGYDETEVYYCSEECRQREAKDER